MKKTVFDVYDSIVFSAKEEGFLVENSDLYFFVVQKEYLNKLLKRIFRKLSKHSFSFTIRYTKVDFVEVDFFDLTTSQVKTLRVKIEDNQSGGLRKMLRKTRYNTLKKLAIIPILGPDGVGKTTLVSTLLDELKQKSLYTRFKKIVRRSIIYNITYPVSRKLLARKLGFKPEKDQHDDQYAKLAIAAGVFYYPYLMFNVLLRRNIVFVDRFFEDYLLEDISFLERKTFLRRNWKQLLRFIPRTFWKIHLDAKARVILSRKDELTKSDVKKYRKLNFKIYLEKPSLVYTYINTGQKLEDCKKVLLQTASDIDILQGESFFEKVAS